jgi:hypothetical protein
MQARTIRLSRPPSAAQPWPHDGQWREQYGSAGGPGPSGWSAESPAPGLQPTRTEKSVLGKQKTCPVTVEELGVVGAPIDVALNGQSIQVSCQNCVKTVKKDPQKYLALVRTQLEGASTSADPR